LDELLSSFEVKPLEGQTLEHRVGKLKISRPQKWRGCMGIPLHVRAADILQESKIRENWIPYMDGIANCSTDVHTNLVPPTPLLLNTICPGQVGLPAK
jgi:hypothetical protein